MAKGFIIPQDVLDLHTDMVQELGELFPVTGTNWQIIKNEVQMRKLLPVADAEKLKTMHNLFISLVQKKDNDITYGQYTRIRKILGSYNTLAETIIDHYTGRIHGFYKDVPTVEINTESYSVKKGQTVVLKCELIKSTTSIVDVQWKRKANGKDTFTDIEIDDKRYIGGSVKSPSLCITETREEDDEAIYVCQAKNAAGIGKSDEIRVKITQPEQETNATYTDPEKTFKHLWTNAMEEAKAKTEVFVKAFGKLTGFKVTWEMDRRKINVLLTVQEDVRHFKKFLRQQIAKALGVDHRIVNIKTTTGCTILSFDITGATHPLQASALALAERFSTGLKDSSILLTDESGNPLQIHHNSIKFTMNKTADAAADVYLPIVGIDQAADCIFTSSIAILKSRLLTPTPITSVAWFRIDNEDGTEHAIEIDNKKYFGGSIESPSLVIDDITVEDAGRYVWHAKNRFGVGKSFATSLCVLDSGFKVTREMAIRKVNARFTVHKCIRHLKEFLQQQIATALGVKQRIVNIKMITDNIETTFAALQVETSLNDSQSEGRSETTNDDDSGIHLLTENESPEPFQGFAAEDKPPPEVLKIHSNTVEELGKRKISRDSDSQTEDEGRESPRKKGKRKHSIDSDSESEVQDRKSKQRKGKRKISHDSDSEAEDEKRKLTQRRGYHKHSRDSDSGREDDGSESNQRKENAGNLRKEHDDTHDAKIVYTWQTAMNAVGLIQGPVARGTGFRVGKDKIMTAYHVVEDITKTHKGAKPDLSNLEKDNVFITFNFLEANNSKNTRKFYFKESFVHDKEMDFAILQLRNKDETEESSYPKAITHFKPVYPEHTFALLGHPDGKPMQLDPKVHIFDPESDQGKRRLEEMKKWGRKQGKKSAYDNILDKNKVLFDCWVQHGASGSPGIEMGSNGEPVCSLMLIHGYPNFVFDDQHKRKEKDHPFMIEQGVTMQAIAATLNLMGSDAKATKREIFAKNVFEC